MLHVSGQEFRMSILHVGERDDLVTCPYDPSHRIRNGKLPSHLVKCGKNQDLSQFTTCPFNASHVIRFADKAHHISICPHKAVMEREVITTSKPNTIKLDQNLLSEFELPQSSENWDSEASPVAEAGYNPAKHLSEQMFRNPNTFSSMTKAQKKEFRQSQNWCNTQERQEISNEDDEGIESLITPLNKLRLPREDGPVAQSMHELGHGDSSPATPFSGHRSSNASGTKGFGTKAMLAISKGRGINRFPDVGRPGPFAPGLGAESEALRMKIRSNLESEDTSSCTSEEIDNVKSTKIRNRLQKKINQINVLIEMQMNGHSLNGEELEKVAKKEEILKVLELLSKEV